jgi:hypothetical protein
MSENYLRFNSSPMLSLLESIKENYQASPWLAIQFSLNGACQSGYVPVSEGSWTGMAAGCYKSDTKVFTQGKCMTNSKKPKEVNDSKWIEYTSAPTMNLTNWKSNGFCVKKSTPPIYTSSMNCQSGYTLCSPNQCYLISEGCPMTSISISSVNYIPEPNTIHISSSDGTLNLYYKNDIGQSPIIAIGNSFGGAACLDNKMTSNSNQSNYPLNFDQSTRCGQLGMHPRSNVIDYYSEFNLYNDNFMQWLLSFYYNYGLYTQNRTVFLVSKSKLPLRNTTECQNNDFGTLLAVRNILSNLQTFMVEESVGVLLAFNILPVFFVYGAWRERKIRYDDIPYWLHLSVGSQLLAIIPNVVIFGIIANYKAQLDSSLGIIHNLIDNQCYLDGSVRDALTSNFQPYNDFNVSYYLTLAIFLTNIISFPIILSILWVNKLGVFR